MSQTLSSYYPVPPLAIILPNWPVLSYVQAMSHTIEVYRGNYA